MAISDETAANIAAQLTIAWSNIYTRDCAAGLSESEIPAKVGGVYEMFRKAVAEVDISKGEYTFNNWL